MMKSQVLLAAIAIAALSTPAAAQRAPGDVTVRSGGIGLEERAALEADRARYNLRLAFAESDGEYVADVRVRLITPDGRTVYEGTSEGPFLFARLPPGRYRLEAEYGGVTQVRTLEVGAAQAQPLVYLHWPPAGASGGATTGRG
jgi:hypothetical protein